MRFLCANFTTMMLRGCDKTQTHTKRNLDGKRFHVSKNVSDSFHLADIYFTELLLWDTWMQETMYQCPLSNYGLHGTLMNTVDWVNIDFNSKWSLYLFLQFIFSALSDIKCCCWPHLYLTAPKNTIRSWDLFNHQLIVYLSIYLSSKYIY